MSETHNSSIHSLTDSTLAKLAHSLDSYAASAITSLAVPEFGGSPGEDVREFLAKFKTATITLSDDMKCLAIQKALKGSAKIWAKENLKSNFLGQEWKPIKQALIKRFEGANAELRHLERLNQLKYEPTQDTLLSYIEKYVYLYRLAHTPCGDNDIIRALKINLPRQVQKALNILDDNWTICNDVRTLYSLARRAEEKILAYDTTDDEGTQVRANEMAKLLKEVREIITKKPLNAQETEDQGALALISSQTNRERNEPARPLVPREGQYRGYYSGYQRPNPRGYNSANQYRSNNGRYQNENSDRRLLIPADNRTRDLVVRRNNEPFEVRPEPDINSELVEAYYARYGKPPGPCQICQLPHYNRHCPYKYLN